MCPGTLPVIPLLASVTLQVGGFSQATVAARQNHLSPPEMKADGTSGSSRLLHQRELKVIHSVCVCVLVRLCVRAHTRVCVHPCVCVCVFPLLLHTYSETETNSLYVT